MLAIISDIHANFEALKTVLQSIDEMGIEKIICLGDIGGYYSQVNECCDLLRERRIDCLMGNHDWYLVSDEPCARSNTANRCIEFQKSIIHAENLRWLKALPRSMNTDGLRSVHGGWNDYLEEYLVPSSAYFDPLEGEFFASGHTHVPVIWSNGAKTYCNPGSVGQPRDGDNRASFATWIDNQFRLHRSHYDYKPIQAHMKACGFEPYFYENLETGTRIGGKVDSLVPGD